MKKNSGNKITCVICETLFCCSKSQLLYRNRKTCSHKCRSLYRRNEAIKRHNSGIMTKHQIDRAERYSAKAIDWRKRVFERDDYTCQCCGVRGTYLEADHCLPWAYFPDLRYELLNGRTLCRECHNKTKMSYVEMRKMYA